MINLDDLGQKIIDIGLKCKSYGVRNIAISSILVRKSIRLNRISKVNNILKVLCATNGFNFICNDKIGKEIVWKDGLHLTDDGTVMLADNFTKYVSINLAMDFNVNSIFNNDLLDLQCLQILIYALMTYVISRSLIKVQKMTCAQALKYLQTIFLSSKKLELKT